MKKVRACIVAFGRHLKRSNVLLPSMSIRQAYNIWADQYDTNMNRTRDFEADALRQVLSEISFSKVLEIGCGTGKNSEWLITKAAQVIGVDFSEEMLKRAKSKVSSDNIKFIQADITTPWNFTESNFDLITFSLVLEHVNDLDFIFHEVGNKIAAGGYIYIGELHPFKQYTGSVARFDTGDETIKLECYTHHISEFIATANSHGFHLIHLGEWFDDEEKTSIPRILTLLFQAQ